eukprot:11213841-Lingulodinium_polyedra.AAC.1
MTRPSAPPAGGPREPHCGGSCGVSSSSSSRGLGGRGALPSHGTAGVSGWTSGARPGAGRSGAGAKTGVSSSSRGPGAAGVAWAGSGA